MKFEKEYYKEDMLDAAFEMNHGKIVKLIDSAIEEVTQLESMLIELEEYIKRNYNRFENPDDFAVTPTIKAVPLKELLEKIKEIKQGRI